MYDAQMASASEPSFWPRLSVYDGRAIEHALAPPTLFTPGLRLSGAVAEATFVQKHPPLLDRLREVRSPFMVDPMSLRFTTAGFLGVQALRDLPYAPTEPLTPQSDAEFFVKASLAFQAEANASAFMTPTVAWLGRSEVWPDFNRKTIDLVAKTIGVDVERRPMVVLLAPDWDALRHPEDIMEPLRDTPVEAIYVQPTNLRPTHDGVEKLVKYIRFLQSAASLDVPVVAGRVGAFGLVLQALGIPVFDSGLGEAESFNLSNLNRPRKKTTETSSGGGRKRRIYLEPLKTTLVSDDVDAIFHEPGLRSRFICQEACCRWTGWEGLANRRRTHYLTVRTSEVGQLAALPTSQMRLQRVHQDLLEARDHGRVVTRVLIERGVRPPDLGHLERWAGVLARVAGAAAAA
jgi:hypothetical protein